MNPFFKKKILTSCIVIVLSLLYVGTATGGTYTACEKNSVQKSYSVEELYKKAVKDAVFADEDEIYPLVTLEPTSDMVTWNDAGDKILLLSWHKYPNRYLEKQNITSKWGEIWTFTDREMIKWYQDNQANVTDWTFRLEQLIGLPPKSGYTHVSAFWVSPRDVLRPAYVSDVTKQIRVTPIHNRKQTDAFAHWFEANIIWSYFDSAYPWTRLGYTYDWANNGTEYGLSEFLICKDTKVTVMFTMTTEKFILWLQQQTKESSLRQSFRIE